MNKILLLLAGLLLLAVSVSAYQVEITAPDSLAVGKPLVITGTTTFGIGTPIDVVLYRQLTTTTEIKRKIVYVQSDQTFRTVFDTTGLVPGIYKVEVPGTGLSGSVTMRQITLFDRSDDIFLSSAMNQSYTGKMYIAGEIRGEENAGIQVEVFNRDGIIIFGPQYINTNGAAKFAFEVAIPGPGDYEVSFTDADGYIGSRIISVGNAETAAAVTTAATTSPGTGVRSAQASASRSAPAYFIVNTGNGPVTLYTSRMYDWVIEYVDENGTLHMVNEQGGQNPESVEFQGHGGIVYVKVYPYAYTVSADVTLYGENTDSVAATATPPAPFTSSRPAPATTTTGKASLPPVIAAGALLAAIVLACRKRA